MSFRFVISFISLFLFLCSSTTVSCDEFQSWFVDNGGIFSSSLAIRNFEGMGRGFTVINNTAGNTQLLTIPSRLTFSKNSFAHIEKGSTKQVIVNKFVGETAIVAWLLIEKKNATSFYRPYIESLPSYVPSLLFFPEDLLDELQSNKLKNNALKLQKSTFQDYESFNRAVKDIWPLTFLSSVSWFDYQWAVSILNSRGLRFQGNLYLAPMADLFNYAPHSEKRKANSGSFFLKHHKLVSENLAEAGGSRLESVVISSDRDCLAGDQLFEDYGDNSDDVYLLYHGFVTKQNPFRCIELDIGVLTNLAKSVSPLRRQLLSDLEFQPTGPSPVCVNRDGRLGFASEVYLSVLAMTDAEMTDCAAFVKKNTKQWSRIASVCGFEQVALHFESLREKHVSAVDNSVSADLPTRATKLLQGVLRSAHAAAAFSTTISQDEDLLLHEEQQVGDNYHVFRTLAIQYRLQLKYLWRDLSVMYGVAHSEEQKAKVISATDTHSITDHVDHSVLNLHDKIRLFNDWFAASGSSPSLLRAAHIPPFRVGTVTTVALSERQTYLGVSLTTVMDSAAALVDGSDQNTVMGATSVGPLIRRLVATYSRRDDFHELLFFLLFERFVAQDKSRFWPYLQLLPAESELDIPLLWSEEEVRERLGPSEAMKTALTYQQSTRAKFDSVSRMDLVREAFPANVLSFERYRWATAILDSRSIWWTGKRHLVPMLDLINCREDPKYPRNVHSTNLDDTSRFALTKSGGDYAAGEQLFENYGQPNHIYFMYHGFTLLNNSHDCLQLELSVSEEEAARLDRQRAQFVFQALNMHSSSKRLSKEFCVSPTDGVSKDVWMFLSLQMNNFQSLFASGLLGKPTEAASRRLVDILEGRLALYTAYETINTSHAGSLSFITSERLLLDALRDQLLKASSAREDL